MNSVNQISKEIASKSLDYGKRVQIKALGRPLPQLNIIQVTKEKTKNVKRYFNMKSYELSSWICGCNIRNVYFCFYCLIFDQRDDLQSAKSAILLLSFLLNNNFNEIFSELIKVLQYICVIPMTTVESKRCFSTLKRIKTFLRNSMSQDRLSALL
jgi:hypothetical protein